jgi:transposase InsO family protein
MAVQQVQRGQEQWSWSARKVIRALDLPRASVLRWARRLRDGVQPLCIPPPSSPALTGLWAALTALRHRVCRSAGAPALWQTCRALLSRRRFNALVRQCRAAWQQHWQLLHWHRVGAVWAMDPAEYAGQTWNLVSDLASRFRFAVRLSVHLPAEQVADDLKALFLRHGAPLFLKRDNGSNLVNAAVDAVLAEFGVIPLNSPRYYPRYNGAIENGQRELKTWLIRLEVWALPLSLAVQAAQLWINVRVRRCLGGNNAQDVFLRGNQLFQAEYTWERRQAVKDWIERTTRHILTNVADGSRRAHDAAWRQAVEMWLLEHGFLEVRQRKKCYPVFDESGFKWR